jgi:hypothetical protein
MYQMLNRMNIANMLQYGAVILAVLYIIGAFWPMVTTLMNNPFTMKLFMLNIVGTMMRLATGAFDVLVLLGLAELIKAKQLGR